MAWSLKAKIFESCSCAALCPCTLGPAKPDQGWCSGAFGIKILQVHQTVLICRVPGW